MLRLVVVAILIHDGIYAWVGVPERESLALPAVAAITRIFLLVILWTPIAGEILAVSET
jgi:hypothetical protein